MSRLLAEPSALARELGCSCASSSGSIEDASGGFSGWVRAVADAVSPGVSPGVSSGAPAAHTCQRATDVIPSDFGGAGSGGCTGSCGQWAAHPVLGEGGGGGGGGGGVPPSAGAGGAAADPTEEAAVDLTRVNGALSTASRRLDHLESIFQSQFAKARRRAAKVRAYSRRAWPPGPGAEHEPCHDTTCLLWQDGEMARRFQKMEGSVLDIELGVGALQASSRKFEAELDAEMNRYGSEMISRGASAATPDPRALRRG